MSWWSRTYNRPLKDPLLNSYSLEELAYEYYLHNERIKYSEEKNQDDDRIKEEEKAKADEAWADEMERQELDKESSTSVDQEKVEESLADNKWMEKHSSQDLPPDEDLNLTFNDE